ncbi:MAG: hypothetical protein FJ045_05855 [Crenarchaeota archaeon]|nr:hypothetical protein [Thermoproteota archaeon]
MPRHEKAKAKAAGKKHRGRRDYVSEEEHVQTSGEVVDRTLNALHILGNQSFVLSPFYEHFSRWLANLRDVLSEFESSPIISVDDQFVKEYLQTLLNVELQLEKRHREEVSRDENIKKISENRTLLERIEQEYVAKTKETEARKDREINHLSRNADALRKELDHIAQMKTGIFRGVSKKTKAQKEAEATQKLNSAQRDLESVKQHIAAEQEQLRTEYERRKQSVIQQIRDLQKVTESQELDRSIEDRQAACESLANVVNALLKRKNEELAEKQKKE